MNRVVREKTLGEVLLSGADLGDAAAYGAHQAASF